MATNTFQETDTQKYSKRFLTLDLTRAFAIIGMIFLHMVSDTLNIDDLLSDINSIALINLLALVILPFLGGLAGFFLLISASGNMVSTYRALNKGHSIKGIVLKQIIGGFMLLIFAMLTEGLIGSHGAFGHFFLHLDNPTETPWELMLYNWNIFETIHTIAWCIIINGCVQGLLSLKDNWKNAKRMIISYAILAIVVIGLTQPIWDLVGVIVHGYPFATYPNGHIIQMPWIGYEPFRDILRAPFLAPLAGSLEPIFPYLAVSFIGSIIGIVISQPKEKISKNFPRKMFLIGFVMFISGLIGIVFILLQIMNGTYNPGTDPFDVAISFYRYISFHRHWAPDAMNVIHPGEVVNIPPFSWLAQFSALNGFGIMIFMFMFRLIEFRGKSNLYAPKTKIIRRFGIVAFSNYNNQWLYFYVFYFISSILTFTPYQKPFWWGTILMIVTTYILYSFILYYWEKIKYLGSLEWIIRTFTNNVVPIRRKSFDEKTKWWQRGLVDVDRTFYNVNWIELNDVGTENQKQKVKRESKFALIISLVCLFSILFMAISFLGIIISLNAQKTDGKNKINNTSFILSIIGCVLFIALILVTLFLPIGVLGLF